MARMLIGCSCFWWSELLVGAVVEDDDELEEDWENRTEKLINRVVYEMRRFRLVFREGVDGI